MLFAISHSRSLIGFSFVPRDGEVYCSECVIESNLIDRGRHYDQVELTEPFNDSCSDFTISRQVATITQHLFHPCSPGGSPNNCSGDCSREGDIRTNQVPGSHGSRSMARVVTRGTASRYLDESSDCSEEDETPRRHQRRSRDRHHKGRERSRHLDAKNQQSPVRLPQMIPKPRSDNNRQTQGSGSILPEMTSLQNHYEVYEPTGYRKSERDEHGADGRVTTGNRDANNSFIGYSNHHAYPDDTFRRSSSSDDHKYYDVVELQGEMEPLRVDDVGQQLTANIPLITANTQQFVSESVRRYLEAAEAWDCRRGGTSGDGRRDTCSTCSSSSSDSSEFDYYLDRPQTNGDSVSWGSGNRLVTSIDRHKSSGTCSKQCIIS